MKETPAMATKTESSLARTGFVPGVAHLALDVVDRGQNTLLAVLQDARVELRTFVDQGIDFAEKGSAAFFRFARKLTQRVDEGVGETLANTEKVIGGAVKSARETTRSATDTANTAISGLTASS
jgi:hypothetical protein